MTSILMLSGGADSVAVMNKIIHEDEDELVVIHVDFTLLSSLGMSKNRAKHNIKGKSQLAKLMPLLEYFYKIRPFKFEIARVSLPPDWEMNARRWRTAIAATAAVKYNASVVYTGDGIMTKTDGNSKFFMPIFDKIFNLILSLGKPIEVMRETMSNSYSQTPHTAMLISPLAELGWAKDIIIKSIPRELYAYLTYCDNMDLGYNPCGKCFQCVRFNNITGDVA